MVVSELRGEKIDIIPFNEEPARFVAKALSPARVREVLVDDEAKQATVIVPDDQLSLAIGKDGLNARLAARLTGWRVDIRSETEFAEDEEQMGFAEEEVAGPLRGDPRQRQALPERLAGRLALLRAARAPGAGGHGHRLPRAARGGRGAEPAEEPRARRRVEAAEQAAGREEPVERLGGGPVEERRSPVEAEEPRGGPAESDRGEPKLEERGVVDPLRRCVSCRRSLPKDELLRLVRGADGEVRPDPAAKAEGRGAYVCDRPGVRR